MPSIIDSLKGQTIIVTEVGIVRGANIANLLMANDVNVIWVSSKIKNLFDVPIGAIEQPGVLKLISNPGNFITVDKSWDQAIERIDRTVWMDVAGIINVPDETADLDFEMFKAKAWVKWLYKRESKYKSRTIGHWINAQDSKALEQWVGLSRKLKSLKRGINLNSVIIAQEVAKHCTVHRKMSANHLLRLLLGPQQKRPQLAVK